MERGNHDMKSCHLVVKYTDFTSPPGGDSPIEQPLCERGPRRNTGPILSRTKVTLTNEEQQRDKRSDDRFVAR